MYLEVWSLGSSKVRLGHEGGLLPHDGINALIKRERNSSLSALLHVPGKGHMSMQENRTLQTRIMPLLDTDLLALDFELSIL